MSQHGPLGNSLHAALIHILDDDSLLNVFYLYRPFLLGKDNDDKDYFKRGRQHWVIERWWHHLTHVCQRWRNLIFGSASYLRLSLLCTKGTPIVDMLTHYPPLPLVIEYTDSENFPGITVEDEEGLILALKRRDRVRRVRLHMPITTLQKFIVAIENEYPILEYLIIWCWIEGNTMLVMFPETFHAPHIRHLALLGLTIPIGSRLLTTAARLVTLFLVMTHQSMYFHPNTLLYWLSFMPQLETINIKFLFLPDGDVERQLTHPPVMRLMASVTLPNLYHFSFQGYTGTYLEALIDRITPCPEKLEIWFSQQCTFSIPCLVRFMRTRRSLRFESVKFKLSKWRASVMVYPGGEAEMYALSMTVGSDEFDWLLSYVAQVSNSFGQIFFAIERLTLERENEAYWTPEDDVEHNWFDHIDWHQLLSWFGNVKTLRIDNGFVKGVSRCLESDDGGLLPELQELTYSRSDKSIDAFTSFIDARQNAGRPITLSRY